MIKKYCVFVFVLICGAAMGGNSLFAQGAAPATPPRAAAPAPAAYKTIEISDKLYSGGRETETIRALFRRVNQIYTNELALADEPNFDNYFTRYLFAFMTQTSEASLARLPRDRAAFFRNHVQKARRQEVHDHLVQLTFRSMKEIAADNYHPAVRYNAMMIIGDLNSKELVSGSNATLPLPYAEARDFMIAELTNPKQIDAVRVAALIGILRHVEMNALSTQPYPAAVRQGIAKQIAAIATDKSVPADRSEEGHAWVRGRAIEILAALGQSGGDNAIVQTLVNILTDAQEPAQVRFAAAASLTRLNLSTASLTGDQIARHLANLAVVHARELLAPLDEEIAYEKEQQRLAGGGTVYSPEIRRGYDYGSSTPATPKVLKQEQRIALTQRLLKDQMLKIRAALDGPNSTTGAMSGAKTPAQKEYVTRVRDAVTALARVSELKDPRTNELPRLVDLAREMRTKINDLDRVAKTGGAPAVPAAPAPAESPEGPDEGPDAAVSGVPAAPAARAPAPAPAPAPAAEGPEGPE